MAQAATQPTPAPSRAPAYIGPNITRQYYSQDLMTKYGALDMTQDSLWTLEFPSAVTDIYYTRDDMISAKIVGNTVVVAALAKTGTLPIAVMLEGGRKQFFKATFKADAPTVKLIRIIDRDLPAKATPTSEEEPERPVDLPGPTSVMPAAPEGEVAHAATEPRPPLAVSPLVERRLAVEVEEAPTPEPAVLAAQPPVAAPVEPQIAAAPLAAAPTAPVVPPAVEPPAAPPVTASAPVVTAPAPAAAALTPAVAVPTPAPAAKAAPRVEAPRPVAAAPRPAPIQAAAQPASTPAPAAQQTQAPAPLLALKAATSLKAPAQVAAPLASSASVPALPLPTAQSPHVASERAAPPVAPSLVAKAPATVSPPPLQSPAALSDVVPTPLGRHAALNAAPAPVPTSAPTMTTPLFSAAVTPVAAKALSAQFVTQFDGQAFVLYYRVTNNSAATYTLSEEQLHVTITNVRVKSDGSRIVNIAPGQTAYGTVQLSDTRLKSYSAVTVAWAAFQTSTGDQAMLKTMISVSKTATPQWELARAAAVHTLTRTPMVAKSWLPPATWSLSQDTRNGSQDTGFGAGHALE